MLKKVLKTTSMALLLTAATVASAQELSDYQLVHDEVPFHTIAGSAGAHALPATYGDNSADQFALPFAFPFGESVIDSGTTVRVNSNGYVQLGGVVNAGDAPYTVWTAPTNVYKLLIPFVLADGFCAAPSGQGAYWADTVLDGERALIVEFRNITTWQARNSGMNNLNYQVWFFPDGTLRVHYDTMLYGTNFNCNLVVANGYADKICLTGTWADPAIGTPALLPSLGIPPATGSRYTFSRPAGFCERPRHLTLDSLSDNTLSFSWQGQAQSYTLFYSASDTAWTDSLTVGSTTATLYSLEPNTHYFVAVRSNCDTSSSQLSITGARTDCGPEGSLPYVENFESFPTGADGWNPCWARLFRESASALNGDNPITTSDAYAGNRAIRLYAHGQYGQWTLFSLPEFTSSINSLQLSFYYKQSRQENNLLLVGTMTDRSDTASFTPYDTLDATNTDWQLAEVDFGAYDGSDRYIAVRFATTATSGYNTYYCFIDELMVAYPPQCTRPTAVATRAVTPSSAEVVITDTSSFSAYTVSVSGTDTAFSYTAYDTVTLLSGLSPQTEYLVEVTKLCLDGSVTRIVSTRFSTPCDMLTHNDLPYADNFNSYSSWGAGFDNPCWRTLNYNVSGYGSYPGISSYTRRGNTGNSLYFSAYHSGQGQYAALPAVDYVSDLALTFFSYANTAHGVLEVGLMTDPNDTSTFLPVRTITPQQPQQWEEQIVTFAGFTAQGLHIAFRNSQAGGMHTSAHQYHIDDLMLDLAPQCFRPQALRLDSVEATSLSFTIVDSLQAGSYRVYYAADSLDVQDSLVSLSGLLPGSRYTIRVATLCSDGSLSSTAETSAITTCLPIDSTLLPWSENFEGWETGNYAFFPPCWQRHFGYVGNWSAYVESKVKAVPDANRTSIYIQSAYATQHGILVLPETNADLRRLLLSVRLRFNASYGNAPLGKLEVGLLSNNDPSSFLPIDSILNSASANQYATYHIPLRRIPGAEGRIALRFNNMDNNDYDYIYIDSLALSIDTNTYPPDTVRLSIDTAICAGQQLLFADSLISSQGLYSHFANDTLTSLSLSILPTYSDTLVHQAEGSFLWHDSTFTESTLFTLHLATLAGCDSLVTLALTILQPPAPQPDDTIRYTISGRSADSTMGYVLGSGLYDSGAVVILTAVAKHGFRFVEWIEDGLADSVRTFIAQADSLFTARFAPVVGIPDAPSDPVALLPNPATTKLSLRGLENGASIDLIDMHGRTIIHTVAHTSTPTLDVASLPRGAYFVRISSPHNASLHKLILH